MHNKQKILPLTFFSKNDIFISDFIKTTIPFYYHHFLPILLYKSIIINHAVTNKYIIVELQKRENIPFEKMFNNKKNAFLFFESFNRLNETCEIMKKHRLVHFNLCEDSVIFSNERPYIQDFSQSFTTLTITEERKNRLFEI